MHIITHTHLYVFFLAATCSLIARIDCFQLHHNPSNRRSLPCASNLFAAHDHGGDVGKQQHHEGIMIDDNLPTREPEFKTTSKTLNIIMNNNNNRRNFLASSMVVLGTMVQYSERAQAIITDETETFGTTNSDSAYSPQNLGIGVEPSISSITNSASTSTAQVITIQEEQSSNKQATDERVFNIAISQLQSSPLGIELADVEFRTNRRVYIKSINPSSLAAQLGIQPNWVLVSVNGISTERTNAQGVKQIVSQVIKSSNVNDDTVQLIFRDNSFQNQLQSLTSNKEAVTQIAPAGDTTQRNQDGSIRIGRVETEQVDQKMTVTQLVPPKLCKRGATTDDLLEISYVGKIVETGAIFDGSSISINGKGIPGRGDDISLFFVLGKQPFGQFPPGWDVGLEGMCVGERRRLIIPPVLAYGSVGVPRRGIKPNATLQYDITLISINGLSI